MDSRLACASCHIGAGVEPGNLSLATAFSKYPRISPRSGANETIQERINGCMMRSMNGRALAENSPEMIAMVSYLRLSGRPGRGHRRQPAQGARAAGLQDSQSRRRSEAGEQYSRSAARPVTARTEPGLPPLRDLVHGFVFPPLWGPNSFNDGAGMHRVLTAARFIKARMPLGSARTSTTTRPSMSPRSSTQSRGRR